jgi:hypothetical protein
MQGTLFTIPVHLHGTLAANASGRFELPFASQLVRVSSVASNNSDATLLVGTTSDDDAYLTAHTIGDSEAPVTKGRADFVGGEYPHLAAGTVLEWLLDFDGSAGTAAQNVTIVFWFTEG